MLPHSLCKRYDLAVLRLYISLSTNNFEQVCMILLFSLIFCVILSKKAVSTKGEGEGGSHATWLDISRSRFTASDLISFQKKVQEL